MTVKTIEKIGHNLGFVADKDAIIRCKWTDQTAIEDYGNDLAETAAIDMAIQQISEYLEGKRKDFSIPLRIEGSLFRMKVWEELKKIPYGETVTYAELARRIGSPKAFRAVANACGANPCPIIIPCHRVVASGGKTGGYTGGLDIKLKLLEIEKQNSRSIRY